MNPEQFLILVPYLIKETRKIYAVRDFSEKYDHALFKYPIKFTKFLIISSKRLKKISI
jgi:hypothetical protein